jgi:hypothetical protein
MSMIPVPLMVYQIEVAKSHEYSSFPKALVHEPQN